MIKRSRGEFVRLNYLSISTACERIVNECSELVVTKRLARESDNVRLFGQQVLLMQIKKRPRELLLEKVACRAKDDDGEGF